MKYTQEIHDKAAENFGTECVLYCSLGMIAYAIWGAVDLGFWYLLVVPVSWLLIPTALAPFATIAFRAIVERRPPLYHISGVMMITKPIWLAFLGWHVANFAGNILA